MAKSHKNTSSQEDQPVFIEETPKQIDEELTSEKPKKSRFKQNKKKLSDSLRNIYENDGELPDFTKIERSHRSTRAIIIGVMVFLAVLAGAAWGGFFIFKPYARFENKGLELAINGPETVKAGEAQTYHFTYQNKEKVDLMQLELRLVIPDNFHVIKTSIPPTTPPSSWTLGGLAQGGRGDISLEGYFLGPGEGTSAFQNIATFRPTNFNSDFQAITTRTITLQGSVFDATLTGPTDIAPGEKGEYVYTFKNTGTEPIENVELSLEAPDAFLFTEADPKTTDEHARRWQISKIDPGIETIIKIHGSFAATIEGATTLTMSLDVRHNDDRLSHRRDTVTTNVLASDISLSLVTNGSTGNFKTDFGSTLQATLAYQNNGNVSLGDVTLSLTFVSAPGGLLDWSLLTTSVKGRTGDGTITWTKKEFPALAEIKANEKGTIDISLPIIAKPPAAVGADEIRLSSSALVALVGGRPTSKQIQTTPIIVSLNSDLNLSTEARYFAEDSTPLGSGPLPPQVGQNTNFRIFWNLSNSRHPLDHVKITATLPTRINWTGKTNTDQGNLTWDDKTRTITWSIDSLPITTKTLSADFEVGVTPVAADLGKFISLINQTSLAAHDSQSNTNLSFSKNALTSEMPTDAGAKGKGVVVEANQ